MRSRALQRRSVRSARLGSLVAAVLAAGTAALPAPAVAWGEDGHWIVCELAYRQLSDEARAKVDRLVDLHPDADTFAEGCHWPDRPRKRPTEHYVNYDRSVIRVGPGTEAKNEPNVVTAIIEDADRLADRTFTDAERADALLFLGHWVGDVHQPLHVSFADDRGGNSVDKRGTCRAGNLHSVWDTCLVQRGVMQLSAGESRLDGVRARARRRTADRLQRAMPDLGDRDGPAFDPPWAMAAESFSVVTEPAVGYCFRDEPDSPCAYAPDNLTLDDGERERTLGIDGDYVDRMTPVTEQSLVYAGARLALLIEHAVGGEDRRRSHRP